MSITLKEGPQNDLVDDQRIRRMRYASLIMCVGFPVWVFSAPLRDVLLSPLDDGTASAVNLALVVIWGIIFVGSLLFVVSNSAKPLFGGTKATEDDEMFRLRKLEANNFAYKLILWALVPAPLILIALDSINLAIGPIELDWPTISQGLFLFIIPALTLPHVYLAWTAKALPADHE